MEDPLDYHNPTPVYDTDDEHGEHNQEEDDLAEKEDLVKRIRLFFLIKDSGNTDFIGENGRATRELCVAMNMLEHVRMMFTVINLSGKTIKPSRIKRATKILQRLHNQT